MFLAWQRCCLKLFTGIVVVGISSSLSASIISPGSLLGAHANYAGNHMIVRYDTNGTIVDELTIDPQVPFVSGITVLGSRLFVVEVGQVVYELDPTNGNVINEFNFTTYGGVEGIGNDGTNLLLPRRTFGDILVYSPEGSHFSTINLSEPVEINGIDTDGTNYFTVDVVTREVEEFDSTGSLVNAFIPNADANPSGIAYDASSDTFFISYFPPQGNEIYHVTRSGTVLNVFDTNRNHIRGLTFIPVPEPSSIAIAGMAVVCGIVMVTRRRLTRRSNL